MTKMKPLAKQMAEFLIFPLWKSFCSSGKKSSEIPNVVAWSVGRSVERILVEGNVLYV